MDECKVCANNGNEYCFACDNGNRFKPITNADRIRAMSDEELAEWLSDMHDTVTCPNNGAIDCNPRCKRCWLDWLKQSAEEGE